MRVLVTGASGFVGAALVRRLAAEPRWQVRACSRAQPAAVPPGVEWVAGPELGSDARWGPLLHDVDVVVHLAARVHVMAGMAGMAGGGRRSEDDYHRVNVEGTRQLGQQSAAAGVRRVVFLSSVKVNGERGLVNEDSVAAPADAYGVSKRDGEVALRAVAQATGLEVVIVRPPLVYGPGVKANFAALLSAVRRGTPLPFGRIRNRRSLVGLDNLIDLIVVCLEHPAAASETFMVSDDADVSTPDLVRHLAAALGRPPRLWPVPVWSLRCLAAMTGRSAAVARLTDSLYVDVSKARRLLGWAPAVPLSEGLLRMVRES